MIQLLLFLQCLTHQLLPYVSFPSTQAAKTLTMVLETYTETFATRTEAWNTGVDDMTMMISALT